MRITLKAARTNAGLTQQEAAKRLGVTVDTIGNWERAKSFPNALQIRNIEEVYGVPYDGLIFLPPGAAERAVPGNGDAEHQAGVPGDGVQPGHGKAEAAVL